jgi:uncharacterized phage protein (TIGR01671 family)
MNREIKFRTWDPIVKKMYYPIGLLDVCIPDLGEPSVAQQSFRHCGYINKGQLMQFTGMKDIHGKEIWEGDILFCSKHLMEHRPVIWLRNYAGFGVEDSKSEEKQGYVNHLTTMNVKQWGLEIVGNIFENPELLK